MKKLVSILLAATLAATLLAGCGHTHVWQDATCTAPMTCAECKETEGEVLAHTWQDATCTAPKTCADCGETEGEALPHTWTEEATCAAPKTCTVCGATDGEALPHTLTEANYQSPAVCTVCGAEVGDPLPAVFEERGYKLMTAGEKYDYPTICFSNSSAAFTATVSADNYRIVASDDTHELKDGFEWRIANFNFTFSDPLVALYGYRYETKIMDYYFGFNNTGTVNYNGEEYQCAVQRREIKSEEVSPDTVNIIFEVALQVPVGYDGMVFCIYNPANSKTVRGVDIETLDELEKATPLFYRMA